MGKHQQNLRVKIAKEAQLKLSVHRARGTGSSMSVFEVAKLMDKIRWSKAHPEAENSIFFSLSMN
ncbi:MAG: hypothetical protein FJZ80_00925 [Bacteroidetes bacterium]|nr:hypothetical protein [Bacteroidota bacterium]MBM3424672.1 hypothetical protein [Bacteroidota bacterium]